MAQASQASGGLGDEVHDDPGQVGSDDLLEEVGAPRHRRMVEVDRTGDPLPEGPVVAGGDGVQVAEGALDFSNVLFKALNTPSRTIDLMLVPVWRSLIIHIFVG